MPTVVQHEALVNLNGQLLLQLVCAERFIYCQLIRRAQHDKHDS